MFDIMVQLSLQYTKCHRFRN